MQVKKNINASIVNMNARMRECNDCDNAIIINFLYTIYFY